jgi:hypothetical protein
LKIQVPQAAVKRQASAMISRPSQTTHQQLGRVGEH